MYNALYTKSLNRSTNEGRTVSTPKSHDRKKMSEVMIGFNADYDNWFIKSFWETKKAYRYTARDEHIDEWIEFIREFSVRNQDDLF